MRVLAIETSCDETSLAVVSLKDDKFELEKSLVSSQAKIHAQYGGVVPEVAAREHASWIFPLMKEAGIPHDGEEIDAVAVTAGPGLVPALRIGVELAKTLAFTWQKPLVAVNHLEGHIYSVWLNDSEVPAFPALSLLVSGGHTELILMKDHGSYEFLGMTRDDAAGEAFDKVAKLLGMPYPGGPHISKAALEGKRDAIDFPRPMLKSNDFDFSFAGLKTAVRVYLEGQKEFSTPDVAASFEAAVVESLASKTLRAVEQFNPASVILSGGVSANRFLRETLESGIQNINPETQFFAPPLSLTGDNAAMIGVVGLMKAKNREFVDPLTLKADPNMRLV